MPRELKLLIHVGQQERWDVAARNAVNFLKSRQDDEVLRLRIVANADAVTRCIRCDRPLFDQLKQIILDGGEILLCENSLDAFNIPKTRLPDFFGTVPAAIRALAEFQAEGWQYVRP